tara:strand:+ start:596 stop:808 length:213 start_codon:yes stop_codon:yes gene_type:complete
MKSIPSMLAGIFGFLAASALFGLAVMLIYNYTIPDLFPGAKEIGYFQAVCLKWFGDCVFRDIKLPKKQEN